MWFHLRDQLSQSLRHQILWFPAESTKDDGTCVEPVRITDRPLASIMLEVRFLCESGGILEGLKPMFLVLDLLAMASVVVQCGTDVEVACRTIQSSGWLNKDNIYR